MPLGVSIVICCHNGARRLPQTLAHLAAQQVDPEVRWEVIVVDNASTDGTGQVALTSWPTDAAVPLRVVSEPRIGLSFARWRGFEEAKYAVVSFVDDDNWVCPEWVQVVSQVMSQHPDVGACGGYIEAVCESRPPWWFERFKRSYAVGAQSREGGDVTCTRPFLWGAGLSIRKASWQHIIAKGFRPLLVDRQGERLTGGGDSELCFALRLAGWRLWYEPGLQLQHFLPGYRLEWNYLRGLHRGVGVSTVRFDLYYFALRGEPKTFLDRLQRTWSWKILAVLAMLFWYQGRLSLAYDCSSEGNPHVLAREVRLGRLSELLRHHKVYGLSVQELWGHDQLIMENRLSNTTKGK